MLRSSILTVLFAVALFPAAKAGYWLDHALAFGPGLTNASVAPGEAGITLIGAHRDTQFASLQEIEIGTEIRLQGKDRQWHIYKVTELTIIDDAKHSLQNNVLQPTLVLTTCYPFDPLVMHSTQRLLVTAIVTEDRVVARQKHS